MNLHLITITLAIISSIAQLEGNSEKINSSTHAKFPMQQGIIQYQITGGATGSATLAFDRNGWRSIEKRNVTLKRYGIESHENRIEYIDGDYQYFINPDTKKGKQEVNKYWSGLLSYKDFEASMKAIYENESGTLLGMDSILSKPCYKWTFEKGTIKELWIWRGIPLKIIKEVPGLTYEQLATSISDEILTDPFSLPKDIIWE